MNLVYKTVQVDGLNIFYREAAPANGPVILLLHGVPTSSRMYQALLESPLRAKYRLIAPDFPGFGHSSWPSPKEFSFTFDHLAGDYEFQWPSSSSERPLTAVFGRGECPVWRPAR